MAYPDKFEYDGVVMTAMENAIWDGWRDVKSIEFYKMNNPRNVIDKIDATFQLQLKNKMTYNIQIKRSKTCPDTVSVKGATLRSYINKDYDLQMVLIGTAHTAEMYMFYWDDFLEYVEENLYSMKSRYGDYYIIRLSDLTKSLRYKELPYRPEDYEQLVAYWNNQ